jgi:hypothetical protein
MRFGMQLNGSRSLFGNLVSPPVDNCMANSTVGEHYATCFSRSGTCRGKQQPQLQARLSVLDLLDQGNKRA